jgi:ABC-type molybdate transport system substrate-binding protein
LENQQTITQAQYDELNAERDAIRNDYNTNGVPLGKQAIELFAKLSAEEQAKIKGTDLDTKTVTTKAQSVAALSTQQKERLYALSQKIEGRGESE